MGASGLFFYASFFMPQPASAVRPGQPGLRQSAHRRNTASETTVPPEGGNLYLRELKLTIFSHLRDVLRAIHFG